MEKLKCSIQFHKKISNSLNLNLCMIFLFFNAIFAFTKFIIIYAKKIVLYTFHVQLYLFHLFSKGYIYILL